MKTKLFCFMKNAICVIILCVISNYMKAQDCPTQLDTGFYNNLFEKIPNLINEKPQTISKEQGVFQKNRFQYKVEKRTLPKLKPISPGQQPGWSYFINYGDGNFYITTEELGEIYHNYVQNGTFTLRIEGTPIKTPDDDEIERVYYDTKQPIIMDLNKDQLFPSENELTTKITNKKNVQLLNSRGAVPGEPFTIIFSVVNRCKTQINNPQPPTITFSFNKDEPVFFVDSLGNFYDDRIICDDDGTSNIIEFKITPENQKIDEQRNYFANFQTIPDIEIGKKITFDITYTNDCGTFEDQLILETAKSHDPSFKIMSLPKVDVNCEEIPLNPLDVFIHFENDGEGETKTISITDRIVPPIKIDTIICYESIDSLSNSFIEIENDTCTLDNDSIWRKPIQTILHTPDIGCLTLIKDQDSIYKFNDEITIAFGDIKLKGKKNADYLTEFPPIETMDEVKFKVYPQETYTTSFFCNIADIYFDDNEPESVFDCVFNSCDCDSLKRIKKSILKGDTTINQGEDVALSPDISKLDFVPDKYIWWPDGETTASITVSPVQDKLYMVAASLCEDSIEQYVIGRKIVYVNPPGKIDTNRIINTIVQHVSCYDSLDGSFNIKMLTGDYIIKWSDLRNSEPFTDSIKRDSMANGTYNYTITNADRFTYKDTVIINEPPPLFFEYKITKVPDSLISLYNIESIVYGGVPDYEITWEWQNEVYDGNYNLYNVQVGEYIVTIKDTTKWERKDTIIIPDCDIIDPGIILEDTIEVCADQYSKIKAENVFIDDGFEHFYVLHREDLNNVIDFNKDGQFFNNSTYQRNVELFVSSIVVPVDEIGEPVLDDFCANINLQSTPIIFYKPINISSKVHCRKETGDYSVGFSISGGAAGYAPNNELYKISGIYNGLVAPNEYVFVENIPDGSTYSINVVNDGSGWSKEYTSKPIQCDKLPIELLHFKGKAIDEGNLLEWSTASEIENDYFTISYSTDGAVFKELAQIKGQTTSTLIKNYSYLHSTPDKGLSYYMLTQTDVDGSSNKVGIITIQRNKLNSVKLNLFPNPSINQIQLSFNNINFKEAKLQVFSNKGKKYFESTNVDHHIDIDISKWQKGLYFVQLKYSDKKITKKFLKY